MENWENDIETWFSISKNIIHKLMAYNFLDKNSRQWCDAIWLA
jgi:hypothetical protein